jgi:gliding motility-associated-like protein
VVIHADPIATGSGLWTVESGQGSFNNQFANQTGVNNLGTGVNVFAWTVSSATCGMNSDTLVVVNTPMDLPASTQDTIINCAQSEIILEANAPLYGTGTWTTSGNASIDDIHAPSTLGYLNTSGWQYFVWTITNGGCPATHDTVFVLGNLKPQILTTDLSICLEELPLLLQGSPPEQGISTSWQVLSGPGTLENPTASETLIDGITLGLNYIVYSSAYPGCPTVADTAVLIGEICEGFEPVFPTVITPNFDGSNDLFVINYLEKLYPSCQVTIFNRWGSVVFESTGYENPWDGTNKGEPLPMGTYFYKIELNDPDGTVYHGDISIIH